MIPRRSEINIDPSIPLSAAAGSKRLLMRHPMRVLHLLLILLLTGVTAVSAQEPPPARVTVSKITQQAISANNGFIGLIYYDRVSRVSSEVAGLVKSVTVREGDRIKAGAPMVVVDTEVLDRDIALAQTRLEQIELRLRHTEKNHKRLEELFAQSGISARDYDEARFLYDDALKEKQVAADELEKLLIKKRKSVIAAPFAGVVLAKEVDTGDWVQPGKMLVRVGSSKDLFVRVPVAETLMQYIKVGAKVPVEINADKKAIQGTIDDIDPTADPATKNIFLKVRIPAMTKVAENMSATVFVPTGGKQQLSIIPRDALINFQGKDFVYTVKDGKAAILPVHIVTYLGDRIGVDNPYFTPGMVVVVEGNERLRPDQPVVVAGEK